MRWKDVLRAQLGIFILPVTFFIAFGTIPAFSGQTRGECQRGTRWKTLPSNSSHFPIIPAPTPRKFLHSSPSFKHIPICWGPAPIMKRKPDVLFPRRGDAAPHLSIYLQKEEPGGFIPNQRKTASSQRRVPLRENVSEGSSAPPTGTSPETGGQAVSLRGGTPARRGAGDKCCSNVCSSRPICWFWLQADLR